MEEMPSPSPSSEVIASFTAAVEYLLGFWWLQIVGPLEKFGIARGMAYGIIGDVCLS